MEGKSARKMMRRIIFQRTLSDTHDEQLALSTSVFVLGVRDGLGLVNRLPGVDAIIIDGEGRMHYSDELLRLTEQDPS